MNPAPYGDVLLLLARTVGIFGFRLTFSSTETYIVLVVEAAAVILLLCTSWLLFSQYTSRSPRHG
ncbi:MAG: hypothetical protein ACRDOL_20745 [Streptosporangiaceae bacterium]